MTLERAPAPRSPPAVTAAAEAGDSGERVSGYEPPAVCWEQPFVALAQTSNCNIPGLCEDVP